MNKLFIVLAAGLLASCVVGPNYKAPVIQSQDDWLTKQNSLSSIDLNWWQSFGDKQLNHYVEQAVKTNLDLRIAKARLCEARAVKAMAHASLYPSVDADVSAQSLNLSKQGQILGFFGTFPGINQVGRNQMLYSPGFDALWELDLFGKVKRTLESQQATIEQVNEERRAILLSTIADVVRNYVELRGAQRQLSLTEHNLKVQKRLNAMITKRVKVGVDNDLALSNARSQLSATSATIPNYTKQIHLNAYQLAILLGKDPQSMLQELQVSKPFTPSIKAIPLGLRSDILRRRPDVRAAERHLASTVADIGVAVADWFPQFSLVGDIGLQSVVFDTLLNASNVAWTLGPSVRFPIFQAGRIKGNIERRKALTKQAALQYRRTILSALKDAQAALIRVQSAQKSNQALTQVVKANQRTLYLVKQRQRLGEDDKLASLNAEYLLNQKISDLIASDIHLQINWVSLHKALGGGWQGFEM